jgi:elongation factor Ts
LEIKASLVKDLREKTGAGIMDCKRALKESGGDVKSALEYLRRQGLAKATSIEGRITGQGRVGAYIHTGGKLGVLVELNCETDFVAHTDEFGELVRDLAMQVAAGNPLYIKREDVPADVLSREQQALAAQGEKIGKGPEVVEEYVRERLDKYLNEICFLEQPFIKDQGISVKERISECAAKLGENVSVKRFVRYRLGEDEELVSEEG